MDRHERTRVLVEGDPSLAARFAAEVLTLVPATVLDGPAEGLVMLKVRESAKRQLFYLGEALMTSCRVRLGDSSAPEAVTGLGIALGSCPDLAYSLAVVDAAYRLPWFDTAAWDEALALERQRLDRQQEFRRAQVQRTRVDFSTMEVNL